LEQEAMFVFIAYLVEPILDKYAEDGRTIIRGQTVDIKRACMQKPRHGELSKRIHVDFDPLSKQICYLAAGYYQTEQSGYLLKDIFRPIAIFEEEEEAIKFADQIQATGGKQFAEKKEKLDKVVTYPLIITEK
jgi:hypothetical protein